MSHIVHVSAPSRLHFGLWSLGTGPGRRFGGVGAMVERPGLRLRIESSASTGAANISRDACAAMGPLADRAIGFARRWAQYHRLHLPPCCIAVESAPPEHVGLGTGTQLALAVAAGLCAFCGLPSQTPQELALSVGRGLRSAVGTYGFVFGGLVVEQGKLPSEPISPLDFRIDLPADWRFVLIRHLDVAGLAGEDEAAAMASLPQVPPEATQALVDQARQRLIPAAATADFEAFAASLYRYGYLAGQCFAARQGGPYNGPLLTNLVERIRSLGYEGAGQSSWGPTIFAATANQRSAERLSGELNAAHDGRRLEILITAPCNRGATVEVASLLANASY